MELRIPSGSSALSTGHNEIRKRSQAGQHSPTLDGLTATPASVSPRTAHQPMHTQPVYNDSQRSRSADHANPDVSAFPKLLTATTVKLVGSRRNGLEGNQILSVGLDDSSNDSKYVRAEAPLPPLPDATTWEINGQTGKEYPLSPIPLTPRPESPSRFSSDRSQDSRASQPSIFSLFPRLPAPDFTVLDNNPLKKKLLAPLDFIRVRTAGSASVSRAHRSNINHVMKNTSGTHESSRVSSTDSVTLESLTSHLSGVEPFGDATQSTKTPSTACEDDLHSYFLKTAPSRFTRKFPSLSSASSFGRSGSKPDFFESIMASESGNDLGIEKVGTWTGYKWCLFFSVLTVFGYAMIGLLYSISTWFGTYSHADVMWVADNDILIWNLVSVITVASTLLLLTGLVGLSGALLNSRPILAFYALLLWPSFVSVLVIGYTSYKREAFSLDRKLNMAWSQWYDDLGRLLIQESLHCCGFYNPIHEATFSKKCYPRTPLPGCKGKLFRFEKDNLRRCWRLAFSLVPLHIFNIIVSLLCSNHVDRRFGKNLMPRAYRLSLADVRANADAVLAQFSTTKLPLEPVRSLSHVTDREDRPATVRVNHHHGQVYEAIGQNFLRS